MKMTASFAEIAASITDPAPNNTLEQILDLVRLERARQDAKFGEQNHPLGTGVAPFKALADVYRQACDAAHAAGKDTWALIALEEVFEALAEADDEAFIGEAVQVIAVFAGAIESRVRNNPDLALPTIGA